MVHPSLLACLKSSWSNAEDIRSISAREMPRLAASRRHGATALATSAVTVLARSDFRLKYSATLRARTPTSSTSPARAPAISPPASPAATSVSRIASSRLVASNYFQFIGDRNIGRPLSSGKPEIAMDRPCQMMAPQAHVCRQSPVRAFEFRESGSQEQSDMCRLHFFD